MTLEQLIARFRIEADDLVEPFLWEPEWLADWFSEAQSEAAVRARLLLDDYTPAVCDIAVTAGTASYALHPKLYEIASLRFEALGQQACDPRLVTREWLDRMEPGWRDMAAEVPRWAIQTDTRMRLVPVPSVDGTLRMEAYRMPLKPLANDTDKPEIHEAHHLPLVQWVLYRAFCKPDAGAHDPQRAEKALENFERYFGKRPDADMRRSTRHDEVHHNEAIIL